MAKRRMLSIDFCESDLFFSLSPVTRMLYVHFILSADDEGFVDKWKSVMRYAKIQNKFYQPLVDVGYVIEINEQLILITHWHRHNTIRTDRRVPTVYANVLREFVVDEEKKYIKASEVDWVDNCVPQSRIDKKRKDKGRVDESRVETDKNRNFTTNNQTIYQTTSASQNNSVYPSYFSSVIPTIRNAINRYCLDKYNTIDTEGFFDWCEKFNWRGDNEEPIVSNYEKYVDKWMKIKKFL